MRALDDGSAPGGLEGKAQAGVAEVGYGAEGSEGLGLGAEEREGIGALGGGGWLPRSMALVEDLDGTVAVAEVFFIGAAEDVADAGVGADLDVDLEKGGCGGS